MYLFETGFAVYDDIDKYNSLTVEYKILANSCKIPVIFQLNIQDE
jgi:hypothetical protein